MSYFKQSLLGWKHPAALTAWCLLLALMALACTMRQTRAAGLNLLTEEYPPITFTDEGRPNGLACEIVDEIQRRIGTHDTIQFMPWARAYQLAQQKPNTALFTTVRTQEREQQFKWVGPLMTGNTSLYQRKRDTQKLASLEDARRADQILVPREYYTHQYLRGEGFNNLHAANTPEAMVHMFVSGRGSYMAADNLTLGVLLKNVGAPQDAVQSALTFMHMQYYIAFSKNTPDSIVLRWQHALDDMKRDGSFNRLYAKWLPGETPPGMKPMEVER